MTDITLVYMVAGLSSRFGGKIKQFARVGPNNETLIEYSLKQALPAGFSKIVFIVGEKTEKPFKEMFGTSYENIPIEYAFQDFNPQTRDKPWGTMDALCTVKGIVNTPFVICNGDDLYGPNAFKTLADHLKNPQNNSGATLGYELKNVLPEEGLANRGIFKTDENNLMISIQEIFGISKQNLKEKSLSETFLTSMNIFALYPETIDKLNEILEKFKAQHENDRKVECLLPNELNNLIQKNELSIKVYPTSEKWLGVTNPEDEEITRKILTNKKQ